ncbi:sugar ABC transporter substrate-binding protein [Paenibacillus sp. OV219]|uniref:ABC transporter substrate-binding protein n=1 Tax=Paenibacillus sp. OV219 TaxID=1884377 RepID=UPI0008B7F86C|nr:sugar ABC transporter substrate-binding protein [Paenibacillus sp. OV219]SEO34371.1 multiple sugar transport system substrate-binding protein [Paenibacillus sp. OV219]
MGITARGRLQLLHGLLVATTVMATGCSAKDANSTGGTQVTDAQATSREEENSTSAEGDLKLRMMESLTNPQRTEILKSLIAQFEQENKPIQVELISPPFDQADETIETMLSTKQDLDVVEVREINVADYVNKQYIEPLDAYTASWQDYSTVQQIPLSVGSVNGKLYFLANGLYERQLYYRKDWFDQANIVPPSTWGEIYDAAVKLTDRARNQYGFSFRGAKGANGVFDGMIRTYNGTAMNLTDGAFLNSGSTIYSTPAADEALTLYKKLYENASPKESVYWGFDEQVKAFTSGQTAMLLQDSDVIQTLQTQMKPGTWAAVPMPKGPSGKSLITVGAAGWGIPSASPHKDAAWKLIAFLSSSDQNTAFSKQYGLVPIHTTAATDPFFMTGPYKTLLDMTNDPDTYLYYQTPIKYPGNNEWSKVSTTTEQEMLLGKATVQETLVKWDAYWKEQQRLMLGK